MLTIGLTGGVGCGKSTVAELFQRNGVPVVDADDITRDLTAADAPALSRISSVFGDDVLLADGQLDRRKLRRMVFDQPEARQQLEGILHPLVREEIRARVREVSTPYCLVVIPLLVESSMTDLVDRVLVVDCEEADQIARVTVRDQCSVDDARAIIATQASRQSRLAIADDVIVNAGSLDELKIVVQRLNQRYFELGKQKAALDR
ncbi:MAG: dephospho-CoA kinase [Pseudomonadota bacterium]|nr:dephospho-CoA kinase [Pseudomonadota bacterium]